ncbi:MAG: Holliday junction resolvase RuvX [Parachlamydiales bacterium]|nr:Holliday junction resolvase RuvX [Parachlamydiales bacterium]
MGRIAAVDFGTVRIGLALTDSSGIIAMPFKTIETKKTLELTAENILLHLSPYMHEMEKIIIGFPLLMNGTEGEMAQKTKDLKIQLEKKISLPIILVDERLTTAQAEKDLKEKKISRKKRKKIIDPIAACLLLGNYLEKENL